MEVEGHKILLILLAIVLSAFFSAAETALISVNRIRFQQWLEEGGRMGWLARRYLDRPGDLLSTLLVGNNLVNIIATVLIADLVFLLIPEDAALPILVTTLVIPALSTPPILFLGEVIPKTIAREHAARLLPVLTPPLRLFHYLLVPVARTIHALSGVLIAALGMERPERESLFTRKNIQRVLIESERNGVLQADERDYIAGVFDFSETPVREVMTPRTDIAAVENTATIHEIAERIDKSNYSRLPVFKDSLDHIIGFMHVMDLLLSRETAERPLIHPVLLVPETRKCDSLFYEMRQKKVHMAVVLDEYGGTSGIVTLEDLLEELVGDIHDVHDERRAVVRIGLDRSIIVDGRTRLEELEDKLELPQTENEVETIGGLVSAELGRIPEAGERFQFGKLRITVLESSPKRIERLRIKPLDASAGGEDEE